MLIFNETMRSPPPCSKIGGLLFSHTTLSYRLINNIKVECVKLQWKDAQFRIWVLNK